MSDAFSEADLLPSPEEKRRTRDSVIDRVAAAVAMLAAGVLAGGMVALGACAAPAVFRLAPAPFSGLAMGEAFARFDRVAIGAAVVALFAEVVRTFLARRERPSVAQRARRLSAIALAGCTAVMGLSLSPTIRELHQGGASRGQGEAGQRLDAVHKRAELVGKIEIALAVALVGLHMATVRAGRDAEDDLEAPTPLPPGPAD